MTEWLNKEFQNINPYLCWSHQEWQQKSWNWKEWHQQEYYHDGFVIPKIFATRAATRAGRIPNKSPRYLQRRHDVKSVISGVRCLRKRHAVGTPWEAFQWRNPWRQHLNKFTLTGTCQRNIHARLPIETSMGRTLYLPLIPWSPTKISEI